MVTRLQSEKGSFVQSPKGAFDGEEAAEPTLTVRYADGSITTDAFWSDPTTSPCSIGEASFGGSGGQGLFTLTIDGNSPTLQEYLDHFVGTTWYGLTSGEAITFGEGSSFCSSPSTQAWIPGTGFDRVQLFPQTDPTYLVGMVSVPLAPYIIGEFFSQTPSIYGAPMAVDSPVSVFECPGQFVSPVTYVRNEVIVKSAMDPPLPPGVQITKVNSVRTPTGFVLDTSTIPVDTNSTVPCFNVGPTGGYWTWFQDVPGAPGSQDQIVWQARIYVDNSNPNLAQFTQGEYFFDLEYS